MGILGFTLAACATTGPSKPSAQGPIAPVPAGVTCPSSVDDAGWAKLPPACKGRLALDKAVVSGRSHAWNEALRWSKLASENLEPSLKGLAEYREAEARYALGVTAGVEEVFRAALAPYARTRVEGEIHYYLGELAFARRDYPVALGELAAAIRYSDNAPWRQAAESLLILVALEPDVGPVTAAGLPQESQALLRFGVAERLLREGKHGDALQAFKSLEGDADLRRLGLDERVATRLEELGSRGAAKAGTIGVVLPLTGRAAPFGHYTLRGILLGIDPFADPELSLLVADDRGEPFRSTRAVRAIAQNGAAAIIGPLIGKSAEAGVSTAHALGIPMAVLSSAELPRLAPWAVRMAVTPSQQVEALLRETMNKRGFKRFAILHPADTFGLGMRDVFWDAVLAGGGQITGVESYEPGSTDFKRSIRAMVGADEFTPEELKQRKAANQPLAHLDFDGVFIPDGGRTVGLVLPQLLYFDVRGPVFLGPSTWNDPRLVELGREYAEGTLFVDWFWAASETEETKRLIAAYESLYGEGRPPSVTAQGYEAGKMMAAVAKGGSREAVRDAMFNYRWQSFSGQARVSPSGEIERPLTYLTVEGKQIVPVEQTGF
jgi:ABC-type branched-subunit amino acid transport system substrate-binding protein